MIGDIIFLLILVGLGTLIGNNWRFEKESKIKERLLAELHNELTEELKVAKNLNESLAQDIVDLKAKLRKATSK